MNNLDKEFKYYQQNKATFLKEYEGKVIVIKDEKIVGIYDSEIAAYEDSVSRYKLGSFLIQPCLQKEQEDIQSFHSRVIFS